MIPPVLSQVGYPGAGDVDDCWVVATVWAATAADPTLRKPTVTAFRRAAGDPDDGVQDGGNLDEVVRGARGTWPDTPVLKINQPWASFRDLMVDTGRFASLAVLASALPPLLQFGFRGPHQVGVAWDGAWHLMNPLAPSGSAPRVISEAALKSAALALPYGGNVRAALFTPPAPEDTMEPLYSMADRLRTFDKGTPVYDKPNGVKVGEIGDPHIVYEIIAGNAPGPKPTWGLIDGGGEGGLLRWVRLA